MVIGFLPEFTFKASADTPTLTITEFHMTDSSWTVDPDTYEFKQIDRHPSVSLEWTATGLEALSGNSRYNAYLYVTPYTLATTRSILEDNAKTSGTATGYSLRELETSDSANMWMAGVFGDNISNTGGSYNGMLKEFFSTEKKACLNAGDTVTYQLVIDKVVSTDTGYDVTTVVSSALTQTTADYFAGMPYMTADMEYSKRAYPAELAYGWSDALTLKPRSGYFYEADFFVWPEAAVTMGDPYSTQFGYINTVSWSEEMDDHVLTSDGAWNYGYMYWYDNTGEMPNPVTLAEGMWVVMGLEIYEYNSTTYESTVYRRAPAVEFQISGGATVTQPWVTLSSSTAVSQDKANLSDVVFTKHDGDFTFASLSNGTTALTLGTDYTVSGDTVTIKKEYLATLGAGEYTFTLGYTGDTAPTEPTVTVTLTQMCSPVVTITGFDDADITADCTVTWKKGSTALTTPISVNSGTTLTYTATPGDALKVDGVQYYTEATGEVTFTEEHQSVAIALGQTGTVTAVLKAGENVITDGFTVYWYSRGSGSSFTSVGSGITSPKVEAGTVLYCDIIMSGENEDRYPNAEKIPVTVEFGNKSQEISITAKNNIALKITAPEGITSSDYTVIWYQKEGESYKRIAEGEMLSKLQSSVGKEFYYEITPRDYSKNGSVVYNWLKFRGIPLSEATKVTVTEAAQEFGVTLTATKLVTLSGTVTNAAVVGTDNLAFSVTQDPFAGYLSGSSYYSYGSKWNDIALTLNDDGTFTAPVWDLGVTLKIKDSTDNFKTVYKYISVADLAAPLSITMSAEDLPTYIPLLITKQYPSRNNAGYDTTTLSRGYWNSDEGIFNDMVFTLKNGDTVIPAELYTVSPDRVEFTGDVSAYFGMGDTLTLSYTVEDIKGEVVKTSDSVKVLKYYSYGTDYEDQRFDLSYKEYGRAYITAAVVSSWYKHAYAVYDSNGDLVSGEEAYGSSSTSGLLVPGTYTAVVWRSVNWLSVPSKLSTLTSILSSGEYVSNQFTVSNGLLTYVTLGTPGKIADRALFTEDTGFKDESVNVVSEEWTLVTLPFEVDPTLAATDPNAEYAFTVQTLFGIWTLQKTIETRQSDYHSTPESDKYISIYCDGKLTESTVKSNGDVEDVRGFTVYTDKTKGTIYFYIRGVISGKFPITAEGAIVDKNHSVLRSVPVGEMTVNVTASTGTLNFASDYLYTSDNGGSNGVWLYTDNGSTVDLYMDDVKIRTQKANGIGIASFNFYMNDTYVGDANVSTFRANDPGWTLSGEHTLYAISKKGDKETRSATSTMTCATKDAFAPAILSNVEVKHENIRSIDIVSLFSFNPTYSNTASLKSYYFPPEGDGDYTYTFTATVNNGDNVDSMYITVTGQDGEEYIAELKRDGNTNDFVGSVSGEKLLFTNWSVSVKSKADITIKGDYIGDEDAFLAAYGSQKITDPATGTEMTVNAYYQQQYDELVDTYLEEQEQYIQDRQEVLDIFLEGMKEFDDMLEGANFDYSTFDGSEESMKALMEHFGIYEGVYADVPESVWAPRQTQSKVTLPDGSIVWFDEPEPYTETIGSDGRIIRATTTEEIDPATGHLICVQYAVGLPLNGDEGYSYIQGLDCGEMSNGIAAMQLLAPLYPYNAGEVLQKLGGGDDKNFPTMSKNGIQKMQNCSSILNAIHNNVVGKQTVYSQSVAGYRAALNVGYQTDHRQQTKAQIGAQTAADGIVESGKLSGDDLKLAKDIQSDIKAICAATETADFATAMKIMMDKINIVADSLNEVKDGVTDFLEKGFKDKLKDDLKQKAIDEAKEAIEDKTGITIPTDLKEACMMLLDVYSSGKLSEAEKKAIELYLKTQVLARRTKTRIPRDASSSNGSGITGRSSGGSARATHDPEGIIYEAVLSNPVEGATATLYERAADGTETVWDANEYGQINPQETTAAGWYQWFVPEGEWQVRVTAPAGSDLQDNTSADNPAANLDDGSTAGWLPVMPVQLGINIPLVSVKDPEIVNVMVTADSIEVTFNIYMDTSTFTNSTITVSDGTNDIPCTVTFLDEEADPLDDTKSYAMTIILTPASGALSGGRNYTVSVTDGALGYNGKGKAGSMSGTATAAAVTGIVLDKTAVTVNVGETVTLIATVSPPNASDNKVTWTSSDISVATVSEGTVTAHRAGTAVITARVAGFSATCTVTVKAADNGGNSGSGGGLPHFPVYTRTAVSDTANTGTTKDESSDERNKTPNEATGKQNDNNGASLAWNAVPEAESYRLYIRKGRKYVFVCRVSAPEVEVIHALNGRYYISAGGKYFIYKYDKENGKFVKMGSLSADKIDTVAKANNVTDDYMIKYIVNGKESAEKDSFKVSVRIYYKPAVTAAAKNGGITLKWDRVPGATKYKVCRYMNGKLKELIVTEKTAVRLTNAKSGRTYSFAVRAYVNGKWTKVYKSDLVTATAK